MLNEEQKNIIKETLAPLKPGLIGVFGSYARGEESSNSDLDILIEPGRDINLLDLIGIEQELNEKLGIKVDLITTRSVNPGLKGYIERDLIRL